MGGQEHTHTAPHHAHVQGDDPSVWSCKQCGIDDMESNIICDLCNEVWHVSCLEPEVRDAAAEAQIDSSVLIERITNNETTLDNALTEQADSWGLWCCPDCTCLLMGELPEVAFPVFAHAGTSHAV